MKLLLAAIVIGSTALHAQSKEPEKQVIDLNQIDLEQVEEDWDSTPKPQGVEVGDHLRLQDIVEPSSDYSYASFGKPDPFSSPDLSAIQTSFAAEGGATPGAARPTSIIGADGKEIRITSPLQAYPLTDLKVKGIWQRQDGDYRSAIMTPKNEGVIVKAGDPISSGKVMSIDKEAMIVRLYKIRNDGVREYEDQRLSIGGLTKLDRGVIKLDPGKEPQFLTPDANGLQQPAAALNGINAPAAPAVGAPAVPVPGAPAVPNPLSARPGAAVPAQPVAVQGTVPAIPVGQAAAGAQQGLQPGVQPAYPATPAVSDPVSRRPGSAK